MTSEQLVEKLRSQREAIDAALDIIAGLTKVENKKKTAARIIKAVSNVPAKRKVRKYKKGTHWTQKPENRARLRKMLLDAHKKRAELRKKESKRVK